MRIQPFPEVLRELNGGHAMNELSKSMAKLVKSVRETGKMGELTFKVKVKLASRGADNTLMLEDCITVREPLADRAQTIFYADDDGVLQRNDPRQLEFGQLEEVSNPVVTDALVEVAKHG